MFKRIAAIVVLVPVAVVLIALAVANRNPVAFTLDPFNPGTPGLTVAMPLFVYLFAALALGIVMGSIATWVRQRHYRRMARRRGGDFDKARRAPPSHAPSLPRQGA